MRTPTSLGHSTLDSCLTRKNVRDVVSKRRRLTARNSWVVASFPPAPPPRSEGHLKLPESFSFPLPLSPVASTPAFFYMSCTSTHARSDKQEVNTHALAYASMRCAHTYTDLRPALLWKMSENSRGCCAWAPSCAIVTKRYEIHERACTLTHT